MGKGRLEAFSDGVFAIIITIMVLELKAPHEGSLSALVPLLSKFVSYILSFVYVGIYWNNHHHLLHAVKNVNGGVLWANLHLLFWLSLVPFATDWMGESHFTSWPVASYGFLLFMSAVAFTLLTRVLIRQDGHDGRLATALGKDYKSKASLCFYTVALPLAFINRWIAFGLYVLVAIMWFIPDRRIERQTS